MRDTKSKIDAPTAERESNELRDEELDTVTGGDIHVTKQADKASPTLFLACATGKHY